MFDWVYFSQFLGKFKNADADTETIQKHREETLSERQRQQAKTNLVVAEQRKELKLADDNVYNVGDYVFIKRINRFAQIECLLVLESTKWADLTLFSPHEIDNESGMMHADDDLPDVYEMYELKDLSKALVTCELYGIRWFVSYFEGSEVPFSWLTEHISL